MGFRRCDLWLVAIACGLPGNDLCANPALTQGIVGFGEYVFNSAWEQETFVQLSVFSGHVVALRADGQAAAWGLSRWGQCRVPALPTGRRFLQISAGWRISSGLLDDGTIIVWGDPQWGSQLVPSLPPGLTYISVSSGGGWSHSLAIRSDGSAVAWGLNHVGQCDIPPLPPGLSYTAVSAGGGGNIGDFSLGLRSDGEILRWGSTSMPAAPTLPPGSLYIAVEAGTGHALALRSDGALIAWGNNDGGQCNVPSLPPGQHWIDFAPGYAHSLGLLSNGTILAWGLNAWGEGDVPALPAGLTYTAVEAGVQFSIALRSDGRRITFGNRMQYVDNLPLPKSPIVQMDARTSLIALSEDGTFTTWGGILNETQIPPPVQSVPFIRAEMGFRHALALRSDGVIEAWGSNGIGQCNIASIPAGVPFTAMGAGRLSSMGIGHDGTIHFTGSLHGVLPPTSSWVGITGGLSHTAVLHSSGFVQCFGLNYAGQLNVPPLPPGTVYTRIKAGYDQTMAIRSDDRVVGWGSLPINLAPPPGARPMHISAGTDHCGILWSDGTLTIVGSSNFYGQLSVPQLPSGMRWVDVAAGEFFTVARYECEPPTGYCTPKVNSLGCTPSISLSGTPSASAAGPSVLSTTDLLGGQLGTYFHSTDAPLPQPFHGGFLCVGAPALRHGPQSTGGNPGSCQGILTEDLNAYIASGADPALVPGQTLWIQAWTRDSGDTFGDSLSAAIEATICP